MNIAALVQARTSSSRLPGKVLREVNGQPLLQYVIERLQHSELLDSIVVATSINSSDDGIAALCARLSVDCHRGPLHDVAARYLGAAERRQLDGFVRVSGDSPLLDQTLVDKTVALFRAGDYDLTTNVFPRSFPAGQSVEVISTDALHRGYERMVDPADFEHVTPFFYRHHSEFSIHSFTAEIDLSRIQLAVDTEADLMLFASIVAAMERPHWTYRVSDLVELAQGKAAL
jgi:spore coat polysaccharide biosynthesis protein SpsF